MDILERYRQWLEGECKALADQIRIIEDGSTRYHTMADGKMIDATDDVLAHNKRKLLELQEILKPSNGGFQTQVGEMKAR